MLREPTHLNEFDWYKLRSFAIWRKNGTIICISRKRLTRYPEKHVYFELHQVFIYDLHCVIYGKTDAAIAETVAFFWSLQHTGSDESRPDNPVLVIKGTYQFDFGAHSVEPVAQSLDANPHRQVKIRAGKWSPESCVILATRSFPLKLTLARDRFAFTDGGAAFVDALQGRQSSFGSLGIFFDPVTMPFTRENLHRLFQLDNIFEKLDVCCLKEDYVLAPLSAKVNALSYQMDTEKVRPNDFHCLAIPARTLNLKMVLAEGGADRALLLNSFLNRVAELGHFESLTFSAFYWRMSHVESFDNFDKMTLVAQALVGAIKGNPNLKVLNWEEMHTSMDWVPHMQTIFRAMEEHKSLQHVYVDKRMMSNNYSWLEQLLSRNRTIKVFGRGQKITNGSTISRLYSLNCFYNGSATLVKESASLRPLLVARALSGSAAQNVQYTALLLANHADMLCEWMDTVDLETSGASTGSRTEESPVSTTSDAPNESDRPKRKLSFPSSTAAEKASRKET